jgi:hypothetical protein
MGGQCLDGIATTSKAARQPDRKYLAKLMTASGIGLGDATRLALTGASLWTGSAEAMTGVV